MTPPITPLPCLRDNYAYLIEAPASVALVIDPSEAEPVQQALARRSLRLGAILATHHHLDHVGGIPGLLLAFPGTPVLALAPDDALIHGVTRTVQHDEIVPLAGLSVRCLAIPGHTLGAVAYLVSDGSPPGALFTGDTLFGAGCGRLFKGQPADLHRSLNLTLGSLDGSTPVYCGHEYTEANLRFARAAEPGNDAIPRRQSSVEKLRLQNLPTVPFLLSEERATNPFLRCGEREVRGFVGAGADDDEVEVFRRLRAAKDRWR